MRHTSHMRHAALRTIALVAAVGIVAACSSGGRPTRPGPTRGPSTTLEVDNQSFTDMNVFVVNGGMRIRLGRATGKTKASLTIPASVLGGSRELQFLAEPLARNRGAVSDRIWVTPGDRIRLLIPPSA